ncbi:MAG: cupin domain-containing protein, partial [Devosia sp.]
MAAVTAPEIVRLKRDAQMPNSALPVLVYRQPLSGDDLEKRIRKMFEANHWHGIWRNGIYDYHHFHSNAHEVLGIAHGTVEVKLGGDSGETLTLAAGDVVVLPAGTGHCRLSDGRGLVVMG